MVTSRTPSALPAVGFSESAPLAGGQLPGERPLRPLGGNDLLALAVAGVRPAWIVKVPCSTVTSMLAGSTPGRPASTW
jgi:hypothetical protein